MDIFFKTKQLEKVASNEKLAYRKLGPKRAELFFMRLQQILAADSFADLRYTPGHFHELFANREGQWALNLDHPYRLIITPRTEPVKVDGHYKLEEIRDAVIIEIVDYH